MKHAIRVKSVTKIYKIYEKPIDRLKEALNPFRKKYHINFYALKNVSFDVKKGEALGIIGRNGAGKSTLLKIITGVLMPTSGSVEVNGKVASLLELGAGFNPDMTGMENIYLQGIIMGFNKEEIDSKIEDILSFADIGDFIHQPVKMYSSGMFARIAFATAINVEPDILIVDETLSVGDVRFQAKCMRKMEEISKNGVTIIFVSHDIQAINKFCENVIWLDSGELKLYGSPSEITEKYISYMIYGYENNNNKESANKKSKIVKKSVEKALNNNFPLIDISKCDSFGEKKAFITGILFLDKNNKPVSSFKQGEWITFVCEFFTSIDLFSVAVGVLFKDRLNNEILAFNNYMYKCPIDFVSSNTRMRVYINFKVPKIYPTEYAVTVALSEGTQMNHIQQHWIYEAIKINIISYDNIDMRILSLYSNEIKFSYEKVQ